jgi:hypothetical protein
MEEVESRVFPEWHANKTLVGLATRTDVGGSAAGKIGAALRIDLKK